MSHHSAALEGNSLSLQKTKEALDEFDSGLIFDLGISAELAFTQEKYINLNVKLFPSKLQKMSKKSFFMLRHLNLCAEIC